METLKAIANQPSVLIDSYPVNGTIGNVDMSGAPIMHFSLVVIPSVNSVSGSVIITKAITSPNDQIIVKNIKGIIRTTGADPVTKIVVFEGSYLNPAHSLEMCALQEKLSAYLAIDEKWNGRGGFSYENHDIEYVPVKRD